MTDVLDVTGQKNRYREIIVREHDSSVGAKDRFRCVIRVDIADWTGKYIKFTDPFYHLRVPYLKIKDHNGRRLIYQRIEENGKRYVLIHYNGLSKYHIGDEIILDFIYIAYPYQKMFGKTPLKVGFSPPTTKEAEIRLYLPKYFVLKEVYVVMGSPNIKKLSEKKMKGRKEFKEFLIGLEKKDKAKKIKKVDLERDNSYLIKHGNTISKVYHFIIHPLEGEKGKSLFYRIGLDINSRVTLFLTFLIPILSGLLAFISPFIGLVKESTIIISLTNIALISGFYLSVRKLLIDDFIYYIGENKYIEAFILAPLIVSIILSTIACFL